MLLLAFGSSPGAKKRLRYCWNRATDREVHSLTQPVGQVVNIVVVGIGAGHLQGRNSVPRTTHCGGQSWGIGLGQNGRAVVLVIVGQDGGGIREEVSKLRSVSEV